MARLVELLERSRTTWPLWGCPTSAQIRTSDDAPIPDMSSIVCESCSIPACVSGVARGKRKSNVKEDITRRLREMQDAVITHPKATKNTGAGQRVERESPDSFRNAFQVDRDRIIYSKAFRRLKHKTQAIWAPRNDHVRTRLTHTIEVTQVASYIGSLLGLNVDLIQAIGYGHDIGHPPFGHAGERALEGYLTGKSEYKYDHHSMAIVILQETEETWRGGRLQRGLNLTEETRNGILGHSYPYGSSAEKRNGSSLETQVISVADDISYINHDFEDLRGMGAEKLDPLAEVLRRMGDNRVARINAAIEDVVNTSCSADRITMSDELIRIVSAIREEENKIYRSHEEWAQREVGAKIVIEALLDYYLSATTEQLKKMLESITGTAPETVNLFPRMDEKGKVPAVVEYIAKMTDTFALDQFRHIYSPEALRYYF